MAVPILYDGFTGVQTSCVSFYVTFTFLCYLLMLPCVWSAVIFNLGSVAEQDEASKLTARAGDLAIAARKSTVTCSAICCSWVCLHHHYGLHLARNNEHGKHLPSWPAALDVTVTIVLSVDRSQHLRWVNLMLVLVWSTLNTGLSAAVH